MSFQIRSDKKTPSALKDSVRRMVGKGTGEDTWARAEVVQSTKEEGQVELPRGLSRFGCDSWSELGSGGTLVWGGITPAGDAVGDGWVMIAE